MGSLPNVRYRLKVYRGWRNSLVVIVLDLGSEGPRFEPVSRGWSRINHGPVAVCTLSLGLLNPPSLNGRSMSTDYGWGGLRQPRQVCATLLGARHVPERLCGGLDYLGRYSKCSSLPLPLGNWGRSVPVVYMLATSLILL